MNIDDVHVSCYDESDVRTCWSFTIDRLTFFEVTLDEDSNNLRAWRATLADDTFRPLRWLLPHDPGRRRLDENDEQVKQIITCFVREQLRKAASAETETAHREQPHSSHAEQTQS